MGEPLHNVDPVINAVNILTDEAGYGSVPQQSDGVHQRVGPGDPPLLPRGGRVARSFVVVMHPAGRCVCVCVRVVSALSCPGATDAE
jgi:hypothetical protein